MSDQDRLAGILSGIGRVSIAVSGGIDSLTLATLAHRVTVARMHHAVSPAVPAEATERTRLLAARHGWSLDVFDAGEFADPAYRANPVNRCFFCKTNLYGAIAARTDWPIVSGTNTDDLGEYRPGLIAAQEHGVRHPFVEAEIDKSRVRALATELSLGSLAELPSAPCLSSRIETGIPIEPPMLAAVHRVEQTVARALRPRTVRCRVRRTGVVIELDTDALARMTDSDRIALQAEIAELGLTGVSFAAYLNGSAFLRVAS